MRNKRGASGNQSKHSSIENDYGNIFIQRNLYEKSDAKHSNLLNYVNTYQDAVRNLSTVEKLTIWRECTEILFLPPKPTEINRGRFSEPMTDKTSDVKISERAKVKKPTRKFHLEGSESSSHPKGLVSNFPPTNLRGRMKKLRLSRNRRSVQTTRKNSNLRLRVRFSLKTSFTTNGNDEDFLSHLSFQLAKQMRVPIPSIQDLTVVSGKNITFTLLPYNDDNNAMDDESVVEAKDFLKMKIRDNQLRLTDLDGKLLMTTGSTYVSMEDSTYYFSVVILVVLCVTLILLIILIIAIIYITRRLSRIPKSSLEARKKTYRNMDFGRDSSQSVGKYSYDSGLWLGPGPEPIFTVPEAPYYRPPTVEQIASTPRPVTAVRTRLKRNWDVDERAISTLPDEPSRRTVLHDIHEYSDR